MTSEIVVLFLVATIIVVGIALAIREIEKRQDDRDLPPDDKVRRAIGDDECFM